MTARHIRFAQLALIGILATLGGYVAAFKAVAVAHALGVNEGRSIAGTGEQCTTQEDSGVYFVSCGDFVE